MIQAGLRGQAGLLLRLRAISIPHGGGGFGLGTLIIPMRPPFGLSKIPLELYQLGIQLDRPQFLIQ